MLPLMFDWQQGSGPDKQEAGAGQHFFVGRGRDENKLLYLTLAL